MHIDCPYCGKSYERESSIEVPATPAISPVITPEVLPHVEGPVTAPLETPGTAPLETPGKTFADLLHIISQEVQ